MLFLLHYHEIALKGGNRPFFVDRLVRNLRLALSDVPDVRVQAFAGRITVEAPDTAPAETIRERLGSVFGVANYARASVAPRDVEALAEAVVAEARRLRFESFRVLTKRSDKTFPLISTEVDRLVGGAVKAASGARVDLERPELTILVEVVRDRIFFAAEKRPGLGGFAVGSSGRVLALLSGGIDSPVAAGRLMKRGCKALLAHFHAFPLLDRSTIDKAEALARHLTRYQYNSRLLLVPFGGVQQTIVAACPTPLRVVLYRRFMLRIGEQLARRRRARALVTGDSLGQVASQTLDNMAVIDAAARMPVLRPLVGMDKEEIVREARQLGTYEISIRPDMDCCQLFMPRHPATAARLDEVLRAEEGLDVDGLVVGAVRQTEELRFTFPEALAPRETVAS